MTEAEMRKYRKEDAFIDLFFQRVGIPFVDETLKDDYGVYRTGLYEYKGKHILINKENQTWHLTVSAKHPLGFYELKDVRYRFLPDNMVVAQLFPNRSNYVNIHENCYHLWELKLGNTPPKEQTPATSM